MGRDRAHAGGAARAAQADAVIGGSTRPSLRSRRRGSPGRRPALPAPAHSSSPRNGLRRVDFTRLTKRRPRHTAAPVTVAPFRAWRIIGPLLPGPQRREWDSNPRWRAPHTLSRRAPSTTRASLPVRPPSGPRWREWEPNPRYRKRYTGFRGRRLRPLGHLPLPRTGHLPRAAGELFGPRARVNSARGEELRQHPTALLGQHSATGFRGVVPTTVDPDRVATDESAGLGVVGAPRRGARAHRRPRRRTSRRVRESRRASRRPDASGRPRPPHGAATPRRAPSGRRRLPLVAPLAEHLAVAQRPRRPGRRRPRRLARPLERGASSVRRREGRTSPFIFFDRPAGPEGNRTPNLRFRRPTLYPIELWARYVTSCLPPLLSWRREWDLNPR